MNSSEKLDFIYETLRRLCGSSPSDQPSLKLGLQSRPLPSLIYIGECAGHPWYKMTGEGDSGKTPIEEHFLAGYLRAVEVKQKKSTDYGDKLKLRLHFNCGDRSYFLVSGLNTYFSRAVVSGLSALVKSPACPNLKATPVGLEVTTGDKGKVILPQVYVMSEAGDWLRLRSDASTLETEEEIAAEIKEVIAPVLNGGPSVD